MPRTHTHTQRVAKTRTTKRAARAKPKDADRRWWFVQDENWQRIDESAIRLFRRLQGVVGTMTVEIDVIQRIVAIPAVGDYSDPPEDN